MKEKNVFLVAGSDGLIGKALSSRLSNRGEIVIETTRRKDTVSEKKVFLDLGEDISEWQPPRGISVAYICAAATSLEGCRKDPVRAAGVNVHNTVALAKKLAAGGALVVFPSTNLVYDGAVPFRKQDDPPSPRTEYGRQKADAEAGLLSVGDSILIVRLTKVVSPNMPLFEKWIHALKNGAPIHPFSDVALSPVPLSFVVDALYQAGKNRLRKILQVSGSEDITYEQAARHIAKRMGADPNLVQPGKADETELRLEHLPLHTTLDTARLQSELGMSPPDAWETIASVCGL